MMTDDQGHDDIGYASGGKFNTPVLDEMAENGIRFNRAYSAAPVCTPTRASVLTGRHPNRMGAFNYGHTLTSRESTLPELCSAAGYRTGFFGKWHLGPVQEGATNSPDEAGFDTWTAAPNYYDNNPILSVNGRAKQFNGESAMVTVEQAEEFIKDAVDVGDPFLVVIWTANPHTPYELTNDLKEQYAGSKHPGFSGEITAVDHALGHLRMTLSNLSVRETTLVWFTSDNGSKAKYDTNASHRGAKGDLYEGGIRVPAVIEWPAEIRSSGRSDFPVTTTDIVPTISSLLNIRLPDRPIDGVNLLSHIQGWQSKRCKPVGFWFASEIEGQLIYTNKILRSMLNAQSKSKKFDSPYETVTKDVLTKALDRLGDGESIGPAAWLDGDWKLHDRGAQFELYNIRDDPGENTSVLRENKERAATMKTDLAAWKKSVIKSMRLTLTKTR